jgi:mycothiol synthase
MAAVKCPIILMSSVFFQHLKPGDLDGILACIHAASRADQDSFFPSEADLQKRFEDLHIDPINDIWVARVPNTGVVGYAEGALREGTRQGFYLTHCSVHPDFRAQGIGGTLMEKQWLRVQEISAQRNGQAIILGAQAKTTQPLAMALFQEFKLKPVRYFFEMFRNLDKEIKPVSLGSEFVICTWAERRDDSLVWKTLNQAFKNHWGFVADSYAVFQSRIISGQFQPENSHLVWAGDELVGGCLNEMGEKAIEKHQRNHGWIEMVFVGEAWRRRGIGKALLTRALQRGKELSHSQIGLNVDADNLSGAIHLYEQVGFRTATTSVLFYRNWPGKDES